MTEWTLTERDTIFDKGDVSPSAGGCWFCHRVWGVPRGMHFSLEFDCYYHEECARRAGVWDADDPVLEYERQKRGGSDD